MSEQKIGAGKPGRYAESQCLFDIGSIGVLGCGFDVEILCGTTPGVVKIFDRPSPLAARQCSSELRCSTDCFHRFATCQTGVLFKLLKHGKLDKLGPAIQCRRA